MKAFDLAQAEANGVVCADGGRLLGVTGVYVAFAVAGEGERIVGEGWGGRGTGRYVV